jgi:F0F1-type ATP synthase alpha subunit
LLKQPQYTPLNIEKQILTVFAGVNGYFDNLELNKVLAYEAALFNFVNNSSLFHLYVDFATEEFDDSIFHMILKHFFMSESI